jgi:hypothetical protein
VQSPGNYNDGSSSASEYSRRDGDRRGYRDHRGRHGYSGHHYRNYSYWGGYHYYPYWSSRFYWGWDPYWWGGYYGPPVRVYYSAADGLGALDFDVRPEKAEVFLNGQRIGVADNFDGFPTYLWLEEGTYDVVIYQEGYETIARQYSIVPGVVIDIEDRMVPGEAIKPEDLPATSTVNRDRRAQRDQERRDAMEREDEEWRERARAYRERRDEPTSSRDARAEPSRLYLNVVPGDASVYLDGRVLGTGDELSRLHAGLLIDAGEHELEVVHPDYETKTITFEVDEAGEETLDVELEPED